jgi:hypothetical protein
MEVIAVAKDKFWLHDGGLAPRGAEEYDGPPPIPPDEVRRDLPEGWAAERAWHYHLDDTGQVRVIPITLVEGPDGDYLQFFPTVPRRLADACREPQRLQERPDVPGGED